MSAGGVPVFFAYTDAGFVPLLGFVFQFIDRHLLHTLNVIVEGSHQTPLHYYTMCVQPPSVLMVTDFLYFCRFECKEPLAEVIQPGIETHTNHHGDIFLYLYSLSFQQPKHGGLG